MFADTSKLAGRCNQMMSFGWSTRCLSTGRLGLVLMALLVLACSHGVSMSGFEARECLQCRQQVSLSATFEQADMPAPIAVAPVSGVYTHG